MLLFSSSQHIIISNTVLANIFKILDLPSSVSQVSSNPFAVLVCNHDSLEIHIVYVYPGQIFKVPVALHGRRNGSVPGIVRAHLVNKSRDAYLASLQETQETGYLCENLTYTVFSTGQYELILLRVEGVQYNFVDEASVLINVTLLPCPHVF